MSQHAGQVFSFEPFEGVRNKLMEKVALNGLQNVTVYPVGLGDVNAELDFFASGNANHGTGSFIASERLPGRAARKLAVRRGDDFLASNGLPKMDIVKMDVEGFEMRVLAGLHNRLQQDRPAILMEISPETRAEMVTESRFREHLYDDATILEVTSTSISSSYRLEPFRFESSEEILVVPNEKTSFLRFAGVC
jgi:FkbM family methyltransferase